MSKSSSTCNISKLIAYASYICLHIIDFLCKNINREAGVVPLYLVHASHTYDMQIAYLNVCFKPLRALSPPPEEKDVLIWYNIPEDLPLAPEELQRFLYGKTMSLLWDRLNDILVHADMENAEDVLLNWLKVFRTLRSRVSKRQHIQLVGEDFMAFYTMQTIFLFVRNLQRPIERALQELRDPKVMGCIQKIAKRDVDSCNLEEQLQLVSKCSTAPLILAKWPKSMAQWNIWIAYSFVIPFVECTERFESRNFCGQVETTARRSDHHGTHFRTFRTLHSFASRWLALCKDVQSDGIAGA